MRHRIVPIVGTIILALLTTQCSSDKLPSTAELAFYMSLEVDDHASGEWGIDSCDVTLTLENRNDEMLNTFSGEITFWGRTETERFTFRYLDVHRRMSDNLSLEYPCSYYYSAQLRSVDACNVGSSSYSDCLDHVHILGGSDLEFSK